MTAFRLGLTGSIGMGKSTTAGFFAAEGVLVWDADAAVHRLYAAGGAAVAPIAALCPGAVQAGAVSRPALRDWIARHPAALGDIETIVHPLVVADRRAFLAAAPGNLVLCDVPLLFETASDGEFDATLLVTAPAAVQRARVLARPGMTEASFDALLARQMPDRDKRARATHIIETLGFDAVRACVRALIDHIRRGRPADA
jgi:dephospho-CoA kinase